MIGFISGIALTLLVEEVIWRLGKAKRANVMLLDRNSPLGKLWEEDYDWEGKTADASHNLHTSMT